MRGLSIPRKSYVSTNRQTSHRQTSTKRKGKYQPMTDWSEERSSNPVHYNWSELKSSTKNTITYL